MIVAMLVGIGISLAVNDTPVDVLGYGALGCLALTAWSETREIGAPTAHTSTSSRFRVPPDTLRVDREVKAHNARTCRREPHSAVCAL